MTEAEASANRIAKPTRGVLPPWLSATWMLPASAGALAGLLLVRATREASHHSGAEARAVEFIMKPVLGWAARRALSGRTRSAQRPEAGRFSRSDVNRVLGRLWRIYDEISPDIPREPTLGARMNVRLAAATVAGYRALVETGVEEREAADLIADIAWVVYEKWGALPKLLSRLLSRDPVRRLAIATSLFRRFPFGPPGYLIEDVPAEGLLAFDVRRCPVGEYFRSRGLAQVCVATWCNQDYSLAELWGGRFERGGTLVEGADRCDMRWIPASSCCEGGAHA